MVACITCLTVAETSFAADKKILRSGAYAIDISPEYFPVEKVGSMTPRIATSVHDPLHARCLVIDNGETRIAFAICDSCMIPRDIFDAAKERASAATGIPVENILGSATHTHSAVCVGPVFQSTPEAAYVEFLKDKIAEGIIRANSRLAPVRIGWAVGNNSQQVFNRRWHMRDSYKFEDPLERGTDKVKMNPPAGSSQLQPAGPTDPELPILSIQALDGTPIAVLANYSLHYVGAVPPNSLSADYFGVFAKQFSRLIGANHEKSEFVGILSNGTSGDINNINFFEPRRRKPPFEQIEYVGLDVAKSAQFAYDRVEYFDWIPIKMSEREIDLGVRRPTKDEVARALENLADAGDEPYTDKVLIYARETLQMAKYPKSVKVKLQAIRIGGLGIVASPCEIFVETGLAIKKASPLKPTFTIELANGYNGYLPTSEQHALGGYETWRAKSSYLAVNAESKVRRTLLELLEEVAE